VDVQMKHGLACAWAYVQDRSVSVFDFALACNFCGSEMTAANDFGIGGLGFLQSGEMTFRNDQHVRWSLGINVFEGEDMFVFVDLLGRNLAVDDAAEEAVWIGHSSPDETIALRSCACQEQQLFWVEMLRLRRSA